MTLTELFLSVCNFAVTAGWVTLAIMAVRFLLGLPYLRRIPRRYTVVLWAVVGLRLMIPVSIQSTWSLMPPSVPLTKTLLYDPTPTVQTGIGAWNTVINEAVMPALIPNTGDSVNPLQVWTIIGAWVWMSGVALMLLYMIVSVIRLCRQMRYATKLDGQKCVYESEHVTSPFVLGIFRPKIYLPYGMDEETRSHVIAHERAHLSRGDHFIKPFAFVLLSVYWFQPLLWVGYILLCRDIEGACDERAAKNMTAQERKDYARSLVRCATKSRMIAACPLAFGETGVKQRVTAVLDYKRPTLWVLIAAVVLCAVFAVCFGTNPFSLTGMTALVEYDPSALVFDNGMFSYVETVESAPSFCVDEDGVLWYRYPTEHAGWMSIGTMKASTPDKNEFAAWFENAVNTDGSNVPADTLYSQCKSAWRASYVHPATGSIDHYTVMQRKNGDILMMYSFCSADPDGTLRHEIPRWIFKLDAGEVVEKDILSFISEVGIRFDTAYAGTNCPDYEEIYQMPWASLAAKSMDELPSAFFKTEQYETELKHASVIPILRFASAAELREFRYTYRDMFVFDDSLGDTMAAFDAAIQCYGDSEALFRDYVLYVACVNLPPRAYLCSVGTVGPDYAGILGLHLESNLRKDSTGDAYSQFVIAAIPRQNDEGIHTTIALVD